MQLTVNDISKKLAGVYGQTTGDSVICSFPTPVQEFSEEEQEMLAADDQTVSVMFNRNGKFLYVGFKGNWYDPIVFPKKNDIDRVFSSENLETFDMIEEVGKVGGHRLAVMTI